ncbi:SbtR family transcriptional regulator [Streptomyces bluensis]|uniref:Transcriptional regulator SbtR-like C-terminal domain-containing protein n=2 Tax=Streptomyces bluensis TaxID=33897 RepID=A0ABW6UHB5_9ACTN
MDREVGERTGHRPRPRLGIAGESAGGGARRRGDPPRAPPAQPRYVETACAMQAADYGFADVLTTTFPAAKALEHCRDEAYEGMVELIGRAKATGRLREDFDPSDLVLVHMANAGVVNATGGAAPDAWRRVVALLIQSFETPTRGPLPASPEHEALHQAMLRPGPPGVAAPESGG